jgi:hypothetical protein
VNGILTANTVRCHMADDRKLSDLEGVEREQALAYVKGRWSQYYSANRDALKDAAKLIAVVNAGGAAAGLAFLGAIIKESSPLAKALLPMKLAIALFAAGILCTAMAHIVEHSRINGLFTTWRSDVSRLYSDDLSFDKMQREDAARAVDTELAARFFLWTGFACAVVGVVWGIFLLFQGE